MWQYRCMHPAQLRAGMPRRQRINKRNDLENNQANNDGQTLKRNTTNGNNQNDYYAQSK